MKKLFDLIRYSGTHAENLKTINNKIILTNIFILVFGITIVLYGTLFYFLAIAGFFITLGSFILFILTFFLIRKGYHQVGRFLYILNLEAVVILCMSIIVNSDSHTVIWGPAFIFASINLLPFILFDNSEKTIQYIALGLTLACTFLYPYTSQLIDVEGFDDTFFKGEIFQLFSMTTGLAFIVSFMLINRSVINRFNIENEALIDGVNKKTAELEHAEKEATKLLEEVTLARKEEEKRNWQNTGINDLLSMVRAETDSADIFDAMLNKLITYTKANQGGLFVFDEDKSILVLKSIYAYDRKKYLTKEISPGDGLVGQCFLEKEMIVLTEIPKNYINIGSGLGTANPTFLILLPLISNENILGVIELAYFKVLDKFEIEFLEKSAENIALVIRNNKVNERTKILLQESQIYAEQMRSQEEEMRQNMEELQATQEEMERKEKEVSLLLAETKEKERQTALIAFQNLEEKERLYAKVDILKKWNDLKNSQRSIKSTRTDLEKYAAFQTTGRNVFGFVSTLDEDFKEIAFQFLKENNITDYDPNKWYSMEGYLKTLFGIGDLLGENVLYVIGKSMLEKAELPPHIQSVEDLLASFHAVLHMDHAQDGVPLFDVTTGKYNQEWIIGGHIYEKISDRNLKVTAETPYPDELEKGIIAVLARKFQPFAKVTIDPSKPIRKNGGKNTTYLVSW